MSVAGDRDAARDMSSRDRVPGDAGPRVLPIRLAPVPEEAFDSWLERYAARLQARLVDVAKAVGLAGPVRSYNGRSRAPLNWTVALRPAELDRIARATGVDAELLAGLTLQRYDGIAVILDLETRRVSRRQLWGRGAGSRFCPVCLAETGGRWPLRWRLSWSFCCLRHRVLLVDYCPGCGRTPRSRHPLMLQVPTPGRCSAPSRPSDGPVGALADRCGVELAQSSAAPVDTPGGFLDAQAFVSSLLDRVDKAAAVPAADGTMLRTAEVFTDLKAVAAGVLNFFAEEDLGRLPQGIIDQVGNVEVAHNQEGRRVHRRPGFMAPRTAARMAFAVSKAVEVVAAPDIDTAAERVSWIIDRMRRRGLDISPTSVTRSWGACSPVLARIVLRALDTTLRPSDRLRYRTATPRPQYPLPDSTTDGIDTRAAKLPQQLWPAWALRLMPPSGHHFLTFRRVTSTALLLPGCRRELDALLPLLGQPFPKRTLDHTMWRLADSGAGDTVLRVLSMLALRLDDAQVPIDYQRRRRLFGSTELLPDGLWKVLCGRAGVVATERQRRLAERYLLELLTGSPDSPHPPLGPVTNSGAPYATFCASLRPALAELLRAAAEQQLADHRLGEPLVWEPPFDWAEARAWPGPHVDSIQPAKLQRLLIKERKSLNQAAAALGTSLDHVRLVLIRHPMGPLKRPKTPLPKEQMARRANLTPEYIAYRYQQCGWTYPRIAKEFGVNRELVQYLAGLAGVKTRPPGRPPRYHIDPMWLVEQYVVKQRNLVDIAAELGAHPKTIGDIARKLGLPRRPFMAGSNLPDVGGRRVACAEWIRPAFDRRGALLRVERFLVLIEYPTVKEAAKTLNIPSTRLSSQVLQLERDLGASLLVRARKGQRPLRLTRTGRRFVREVRKALANLQAAYGS